MRKGQGEGRRLKFIWKGDEKDEERDEGNKIEKIILGRVRKWR